jgi:hypothetical protein
VFAERLRKLFQHEFGFPAAAVVDNDQAGPGRMMEDGSQAGAGFKGAVPDRDDYVYRGGNHRWISRISSMLGFREEKLEQG